MMVLMMMVVVIMISISCAKVANLVPMRSEKLLNSASFGRQNLKSASKMRNSNIMRNDDQTNEE